MIDNENNPAGLNENQGPAPSEGPALSADTVAGVANLMTESDPSSAPRGRGGRGGPRKGGPGGNRPGGPGGNRPGGRGGRDGSPAQADDAERSEWTEKVIQIRRVTKVVKGGKKLSFRAVVVVGNGKGQVGIGIGKSNEVIGAIQKGVTAAKKTLITVPMHKTTIPHPIKAKAGGSSVVLLPASEGTGVIAGGAARALLELAGVHDILSKSLGSNSPLNVARATLKGLSELRSFETIARSRGKSVKEILI
jgi:small subunit ribosomal protein S5